MQVLILSARTGWHTDELSRALAARGHSARVASYESMLAEMGRPGGAGLSVSADAAADPARSSAFAADAVLARIIPNGSLEQVIYRVDALHWIERQGIPVVNSPRAIERSVDKFYTTALLHQAGIPVPETVVCEQADTAMAAIRRMLADGGAVIIKPLFGSMGHGLVRVSDPDLAWRIVRPLEQTRAVFYVQRAIDHGGRDVRLFVVGGQVLGAIERTAAPDDWRTNVARGGRAERATVTARWEEYAVRAAAAVDADYCGVDVVAGPDGDVYVLEVNGIPGWRGLQQATGIDVAAAIAGHVEQRVTHRIVPDHERVHA